MFIQSGYECRDCQSGLHEDKFDAFDSCECLPKSRSIVFSHVCGNCKKRWQADYNAIVCCTEYVVTSKLELKRFAEAA